MTMYSIHNAKVLGGPIYHVVSCLIISHDSLLAALAGRTWRNLLGNEVGDAVMACDSSQWQCPVAPVGRGLEGRSADRVASGARSDELLVAVGKSAGRSERSRRLALQWKLYIWTCWSMLINVDQCWSMLIILSYYHINIWSARTYSWEMLIWIILSINHYVM